MSQGRGITPGHANSGALQAPAGTGRSTGALPKHRAAAGGVGDGEGGRDGTVVAVVVVEQERSSAQRFGSCDIMRVGRPGVVAWNTAKPAFPQF